MTLPKQLRKLALLTLLGGLVTTVTAADHPGDATPKLAPVDRAPAGRLVVQEGGPFGGFAGSDGAPLPFNTPVGADLPGFVSNRLQQGERDDPAVRAWQTKLLFSK